MKSGDDDSDEAAVGALAIDRLAVNLGSTSVKIVPDYISTEVDPRLSFDTDSSVSRGERVIAVYERIGPKERVLIKPAAAWEEILAAERLEEQGIQCNITLIFAVVQAVACA
jgi:transaldolase